MHDPVQGFYKSMFVISHKSFAVVGLALSLVCWNLVESNMAQGMQPPEGCQWAATKSQEILWPQQHNRKYSVFTAYHSSLPVLGDNFTLEWES